jgi:hypothetical protein
MHGSTCTRKFWLQMWLICGPTLMC